MHNVWSSYFPPGENRDRNPLFILIYLRERITGSDIFRELSRRLNDQGGASCFFQGSTEETLAVIEARLSGEFPGIRFAGAYSPPFAEVFSEEENRAMIKAVNRSGPDVLWVGMTAPKQEKWIHQNKDKLKSQLQKSQ